MISEVGLKPLFLVIFMVLNGFASIVGKILVGDINLVFEGITQGSYSCTVGVASYLYTSSIPLL